jgi:hypothetical protein
MGLGLTDLLHQDPLNDMGLNDQLALLRPSKWS